MKEISNWNYTFDNNQFAVIPDIPVELPKRYIKYYSLKKHNVEAVINSNLYFSHPLILNDPFDSCIQFLDLSNLTCEQLISFYVTHKNLVFTDSPTDEEIIQKMTFNFNQNRDEFLLVSKNFYWNFIFKDYGLLSLSSKNDNLLMWSYYTNNEGFTIELENITFESGVHGPFPMNYRSNFEIITPTEVEIDPEYLIYLTNIKSNHWKHEDEWRFILNRSNLSIPDYPDDNLSNERRKGRYSGLVRITLGFNFFKGNVTGRDEYEFNPNEDSANPNEDRLKIDLLEFAINNKVELQQIDTFDDGTFKLKPKRISIECMERGKRYGVETHE